MIYADSALEVAAKNGFRGVTLHTDMTLHRDSELDTPILYRNLSTLKLRNAEITRIKPLLEVASRFPGGGI